MWTDDAFVAGIATFMGCCLVFCGRHSPLLRATYRQCLRLPDLPSYCFTTPHHFCLPSYLRAAHPHRFLCASLPGCHAPSPATHPPPPTASCLLPCPTCHLPPPGTCALGLCTPPVTFPIHSTIFHVLFINKHSATPSTSAHKQSAFPSLGGKLALFSLPHRGHSRACLPPPTSVPILLYP